jgi:uncharacterized membrane protein
MTATAAGAVLCALWFVPSAKATPDATGGGGGGGGARHPVTASSSLESASSESAASGGARTAIDAAGPGQDGLTTPFVLSAVGLAGTGGALIIRARRRSVASQASSPVTD